MSRTLNQAPTADYSVVVAEAASLNEATTVESSELRGTLRERLAQYNYEETEAGALIETWWHLVKSEPVSTTHADCEVTESGVILLPNDAKGRENSKLWTNYHASGKFASMDGRIQFECKFKLTPISKKEDGSNSGKKCYFTLEGTKDGKPFTLRDVEVTKVKNFLFGKGGWTSQKGEADGAPHSEEEAKTMAERWESNLLAKVDEIEEILESYADDGDMPDFTPLRECIKVRTYGHAEALYLAWKEEEEAKAAERKEATTAKKAEKFKPEDEEEALNILERTSGVDMEKLFALYMARQAAQQA
jgi:hypothetical protein